MLHCAVRDVRLRLHVELRRNLPQRKCTSWGGEEARPEAERPGRGSAPEGDLGDGGGAAQGAGTEEEAGEAPGAVRYQRRAAEEDKPYLEARPRHEVSEQLLEPASRVRAREPPRGHPAPH